MFKLVYLVLLAGAVSASVLSLRAQRLEAAHVTTGALDQARRLDRAIEMARLDLARLSAPERVERLVRASGTPMAPMLTPETP